MEMQGAVAKGKTAIGVVAAGSFHAVGIVAIGGLNATGVVAVGGQRVRSLLPMS